MSQTLGDNACHPERSEGSGSPDAEIFRFAQDDSQNLSQVYSREVLSPNVLPCLLTFLSFIAQNAGGRDKGFLSFRVVRSPVGTPLVGVLVPFDIMHGQAYAEPDKACPYDRKEEIP